MQEQRDKMYEIPPNIPETIWAKNSTKVGRILSAEPVKIEVKGSVPPRIPQSKLIREAMEGIYPMLQSLLGQGIL